ncbi:MAG: damage-control phosphatase ARMT1 family protein [Anaerolineae bacterium]
MTEATAASNEDLQGSRSPCPPLPLPPPLMGSDEGSFAHYTVSERLPAIVERVITENDFRPPIVENLQALADELPVGLVRLLKDDDGPDMAAWAGYLEPYLGQRWLDLPWYFAEAYFYRRILEATEYFSPGPSNGVDPFETEKHAGLESAMGSIRALAARANDLVRQSGRANRAGLITLTYFALWGNRVDLSLWPAGSQGDDRSRVELHREQEKILVDDTPVLADKVTRLRGARIDFIADNAGFELVCDLCLADFLLSCGAAGTVHLHLKAHPTFVSDTMMKDVEYTLKTLADDQDLEVRALAARLQGYVNADRLQLRERMFWTAPLAFWEVPDAMREDLREAALIFVKGDANYRRLLGDRHWPFTTRLADIVCYFPVPLAALRTLKSELAAGLQPGQPEEVAREDPNWLTNGRWGVIQLVP